MAKKPINKDIEFIERIKKIVYTANRESLTKVKAGDTLVIDDQYNIEHGGWHELRSGDEFRVKFVDTHNSLMEPIYYVVMTKAPSDGGSLPRYQVGYELEINEHMSVYNHIHRKGDHTLSTQLRKLCRDYLDGLL